MKTLAIVGAGPSGLAAAYALRSHPVAVTLFDKSRGVSGRAATRGRHGVRYDHGANYLKASNERVHRLITEELPTDDLVRVGGEVRPFSADGRIGEGDPEANAEPRWTYRDGISRLGKLLLEASEASLEPQTRVRHLERAGDGWAVADEGRKRLGTFDAVLLAVPAPQAADIVEWSAMAPEPLDALGTALRQARYRTQRTFVFAFEDEVERPENLYALIDQSREHPIAWLSIENEKPGHVPEGQTVLIVQMAPAWSLPRYYDAAEAHTADVLRMAGELLGAPLPKLAWSDEQRWRFALPGGAADADALQRVGGPLGLFFAGDHLAGKGRVGAALQTGFKAAPRIASFLGIGG